MARIEVEALRFEQAKAERNLRAAARTWDGKGCGQCGGDIVDGDMFQCEGREAWQNVTCEHGHETVEVYTLDHAHPVGRPDKTWDLSV